jgi:hypothetical protein
MGTFRNTLLNFNSGNCDSIFYNKSKHDLFLYASDPTFSSIAFPGQSGGVLPIALNPSCYINDAPYTMNCSGVSLRRKNYGGYDTSVYQGLNGNANFAGCFGTLPSSVNSAQEARLRNIAYWNNSQFNAVLISPRHAISTKHWLATPGPETISFSFLLSDNTIVSKNFVRVRASPGVDLLQGVGSSDIVVWRISDTQDLSNQINNNLLKCYPEYFDCEDATTISYLTSTFNTINMSIRPIGFRIDGNDRVIRGVISVTGTGTVGSASFEVFPYDAFGNINTLDQYQPINVTIHGGDSGSPQFVYDVNSKKTLYIGSAAGHGITHANSTAKVNAINAELQANGGYSLTKINVNNLKLMSLSDWSGVNVNHNNGLKNIAEIYGNFVVKNINGASTTPVKQLWAKTGAGDSTPTLIWDTPTTPPPSTSTDIPTQPPPDGNTCGICLNEPVYYPYIPSLNERWNCNIWNITGTFSSIKYDAPFNAGDPIPQDVPQYGSQNVSGGYKVYTKLPSSISLIAPPPGYCMGEFTSYSVKDRAAVILRRPLEEWTFIYNDPTGQQSFRINDYYALKKPEFPNDPFDQICFQSCGGDPCVISGPKPSSAGSSSNPCTAEINDVVTGTTGIIIPQNIIFDTGCISTSGAVYSRCISACYGKPSNFINAPHLFDCKFVSGILPHIKTTTIADPSDLLGIRLPEFSASEFFIPPPKFAYTYSDFMFILESGCETGENSAWLFRYFLPIYVTLPNYNHPTLGSNFSYKGKYIEITRTNIPTNALISPDPVNTALQDILFGKIKASTVMISEDVDERGNPIIHWNLIGFPKSTHTHVMMVEILTPTPAVCNVCINSGGVDGLAANRVNIIRFYPITDINGTPETYFNAYVNENIQIANNFYGVNSLEDASTFYPSSSDVLYNFYTDIYSNSGIIPDSRRIEGITYSRFYNSYKQSPIDSGPVATNCNCNPI